jgi:hypothetical protein
MKINDIITANLFEFVKLCPVVHFPERKLGGSLIVCGMLMELVHDFASHFGNRRWCLICNSFYVFQAAWIKI